MLLGWLCVSACATTGCSKSKGPEIAAGQHATLQYRDKSELPLSLALEQVPTAAASLENGDGNELDEMKTRGTITLLPAGTEVTVLRLEEVAGTRVFFVQADSTEEATKPTGAMPRRRFMTRPQGYVPARWLQPVKNQS
jgi:hypothetical protein